MRSQIPWPHIVDHDRKLVRVYVESGYPTVMAVPHVIGRIYPDYEIALVSQPPNQ